MNLNLRSTNPNKFPSFKWFHACAHHSYENLTNSVTFGKSLGSELRRKVLRDGRPGLPLQFLSLKRDQGRAWQESLEVKILITFLKGSYLTKCLIFTQRYEFTSPALRNTVVTFIHSWGVKQATVLLTKQQKYSQEKKKTHTHIVLS